MYTQTVKMVITAISTKDHYCQLKYCSLGVKQQSLYHIFVMSFLFRIDRTETGHVLGRAAKLGPISAPERKLNRTTFSILRLLTHISMYIGANTNPVVNIITRKQKYGKKKCSLNYCKPSFVCVL